MNTIAVAVMLLGLVLWIVFSKTSIADPLVSEVGRLSFFAGLLVTLLNMGSKAVL